jgi:hypothetical protein
MTNECKLQTVLLLMQILMLSIVSQAYRSSAVHMFYTILIEMDRWR